MGNMHPEIMSKVVRLPSTSYSDKFKIKNIQYTISEAKTTNPKHV